MTLPRFDGLGVPIIRTVKASLKRWMKERPQLRSSKLHRVWLTWLAGGVLLVVSAGVVLNRTRSLTRHGSSSSSASTSFTNLLKLPARQITTKDIARLNLVCAEGLPVSGRSKPARDGRMKTGHFESGIACEAAKVALMRDEPTRCEPATFYRHAGGQRLVGAQDRPRTGCPPRDGGPLFATGEAGGKPASSNFEYSGPLSEMVLLGNLAVRNPDTRLLWDGPNLKVTNDTEADAYVRRNFREGWSL